MLRGAMAATMRGKTPPDASPPPPGWKGQQDEQHEKCSLRGDDDILFPSSPSPPPSPPLQPLSREAISPSEVMVVASLAERAMGKAAAVEATSFPFSVLIARLMDEPEAIFRKVVMFIPP